MKQLTKKKFLKKKPHPEDGHREGKHWCNCRVRNRRAWLARKSSSMIWWDNIEDCMYVMGHGGNTVIEWVD